MRRSSPSTRSERARVSREILPDSRAKAGRGVVQSKAGFQIPIYCASCHVHAGWCPAETVFLFYTCPSCHERLGPAQGVAYMPDEIFFLRVAAEQVERYGHALDAVETEIQLGDRNSLESRLVRDRALLTPKAGD